MVKPYKKAQLFNAKGDLSARWFVYFSYQHPATGKFERIKVYKDINTFKTKAERNEHASLLIQGINQALDAGYNPFLKTNEQRFGDVHTLAQAIPAYLAVKESLRDKTVTGYRSILNLFLTWATSRGLHTYELKHLKRKDIQEYFTNALKTRNLAATTHNTELTTIRGFFTFWQDEGLVVTNPAKGIKRLKEEISNHSIYSDGQIEVITTYLKESDTPRSTQLLHYIRFLYYACIRPKELRMLQVKDIRLDTGTILIPSSVSKSGRAEPVDISPGLMDVIKEMRLKSVDPEWYVFGNQGKGVPGNYSDPKPGPKPVGINYFTDYYREVLKALGLSDDHTLYAWKHTRNVHLYIQDKDLLRLMRHNRHTDPKVTMRYLRSLGLLLDSRLDDERRI